MLKVLVKYLKKEPLLATLELVLASLLAPTHALFPRLEPALLDLTMLKSPTVVMIPANPALTISLAPRFA
jgi:hypothetical protein